MASMTFQVNDASTSSGAPAVWVTITENADGTLSFSVTQQGGIIGDLRGLFFDLNDESVRSSLVINGGANTTEVKTGDDSIKDLGDGANMNGLLGGDKGYDVGIEIGSSGIGKDDIRSYDFTLGSSARALTLQDFANVDFGVRLTSVGTIDGSRADSSKILEQTSSAINAQDDSASVNEDSMATGNVLANDKTGLPTGDTVSVTGWSGGALGTAVVLDNSAGATLQLNADGSYDLDANAADALSEGESLTYNFTYAAKSVNEATSWSSDSATFTVTVNGVNDGPVAGDDAASASEDSSASGSVLGNDSDIDRLDTLSVGAIAQTAIANGAGATLALNTNGTYVLDATNADALSEGETINQDFTYTLSDNHGGSTTATLSVTVNGVNDGPVAGDDNAGSITEDASSSGSVIGNDDDIDRLDTISVTAVNGVTDGGNGDLDGATGSIQVTLASGAIVTMNADGTFSYNTNGAFDALNDGETRADSFEYTLSDNHNGTDTALVSVAINGVSDVIDPPPPPPVEDPALDFLFNHGRNDTDHGFFPQTVDKDNAVEGFTDNDTLKIAGYGDLDSITVSTVYFGGDPAIADTMFVIEIDGNPNSTRTEDVGYLVDYTGLVAGQIEVTGNFDEANIFFG